MRAWDVRGGRGEHDHELGEDAGRSDRFSTSLLSQTHSGGNPWANLKSISHRCYLREVAFEWEWTKETFYLLLGRLQGGLHPSQLPLTSLQSDAWPGTRLLRNSLPSIGQLSQKNRGLLALHLINSVVVLAQQAMSPATTRVLLLLPD